MFDLGWSELGLIAVVALIVIGPKDLPRVMRIVGQWVRRARSIAHEFQGSIDQMMREAELDELKRGFDKATSFDVGHEIRKTVDPDGELEHSLRDPVLANPLADQPTPAIEAKPEDQPAIEAKPEDQPAIEAKPEDQPAIEAKPEDQPAIAARPEVKTETVDAPAPPPAAAPEADPAKRAAPDAEPHAN